LSSPTWCCCFPFVGLLGCTLSRAFVSL